MDEPDLVRRSRKGDRQAFARLVERYWDRLYRWLYHLVHDRHRAEDITQETFLKAYSGLPSFKEGSEGSQFHSWLYRIAYNSFLNQQRGQPERFQPFPQDVPSREAGPPEQAVDREALRLAASAVRELPSEMRSAFLLRTEEALSFKEIAGVLRVTEETARWRVFKARQKLLEALKGYLSVNEQ